MFTQFGIEPAVQRQGIGTLLLDLVERRAVEIGAQEIACDTAEGATDLIAMYERKGYKIVAQANWDATNCDSVILAKPLNRK